MENKRDILSLECDEFLQVMITEKGYKKSF